MKVLITRQIPRAGIDMLANANLELVYKQGPPLSKIALLENIKDVEAILTVIPDQIDEEIINSGKNLKIISTYSVGYDHIDLNAATKNKIFIGNTPGDKTTRSVAEHALSMMLALGTKLVDADEFVRQGCYECWEPMMYLGTRTIGKTLGIIGFGRIGQSLASIVKGLDMKILYHDHEQAPKEIESALNATFVDLTTLLSDSDYISIHVNLTPETRHLLGDKEFHLMKPEAIVINTSRGPVINEEALVSALKENVIQGAGLDVFEHEPKVQPELLKMKNVILTPHIASGTREVRIQMAKMAAQNILDVLIEKKSPTHLVNKELLVK